MQIIHSCNIGLFNLVLRKLLPKSTARSCSRDIMRNLTRLRHAAGIKQIYCWQIDTDLVR